LFLLIDGIVIKSTTVCRESTPVIKILRYSGLQLLASKAVAGFDGFAAKILMRDSFL